MYFFHDRENKATEAPSKTLWSHPNDTGKTSRGLNYCASSSQIGFLYDFPNATMQVWLGRFKGEAYWPVMLPILDKATVPPSKYSLTNFPSSDN